MRGQLTLLELDRSYNGYSKWLLKLWETKRINTIEFQRLPKINETFIFDIQLSPDALNSSHVSTTIAQTSEIEHDMIAIYTQDHILMTLKVLESE